MKQKIFFILMFSVSIFMVSAQPTYKLGNIKGTPLVWNDTTNYILIAYDAITCSSCMKDLLRYCTNLPNYQTFIVVEASSKFVIDKRLLLYDLQDFYMIPPEMVLFDSAAKKKESLFLSKKQKILPFLVLFNDTYKKGRLFTYSQLFNENNDDVLQFFEAVEGNVK